MDEEPHIGMNNLPERGGVIQGFEAAKPSGENDSSGLIPRSPRPLCQVQSSVGGMFGHSGSADRAGDSEFEAIGTDRSEDEGLSGDSTATRESEAAERTLATTDGLISIINKQVEDALKPLLSVLRGLEEDERKHQEKLLAIEKRKLALKNEKVQLFTRHGAPSWNSPTSQPQVGLINLMGNAGSAPEPVKGINDLFGQDGTEEKGAVSTRPSSGSDGILQPSKLSKTDVKKCKTPDDKNLPIANKLVKFPDIGPCFSDDSNEGDHSVERMDRSSEGDHGHSDKNLPKLDKVVSCSNVRSCLSVESNEGVHSDVFKDRLSEGDYSHSVDLPKLDKVERREYLEHFRPEDWVEKTEKLVSGHPNGPPKIVTEDETSDDTKRVRLFGQILSAPVMKSCSPGRTSEADNFRPGIGAKLVQHWAQNAKSPTLSEEGELKECEHSLGNYKNLPKPDKVVACPRCGSLHTKFCYYFNYNQSQRRHFCKNCYRYWTEGVIMRNIPVGAGRKKKVVGGLHLKASQNSVMLRGPTPSLVSPSFLEGYSVSLPPNGWYNPFQPFASSQGPMTSGTEPSAEKSYESTCASRLLQPFYYEPISSPFSQDASNVNVVRTGFTSSIMSRTTDRHVPSDDMSTSEDEREPLFTGNCNLYLGAWNGKQHLMHSSQGGASLSTPLLDSDRPEVQSTGFCISSVGQQHQPVSALGKRGAADGGRQEDAQLPAKALKRGSVSCKSEIVNPTLKPELELARACEENSFSGLCI